jgi:hypothetical protein
MLFGSRGLFLCCRFERIPQVLNLAKIRLIKASGKILPRSRCGSKLRSGMSKPAFWLRVMRTLAVDSRRLHSLAFMLTTSFRCVRNLKFSSRGVENIPPLTRLKESDFTVLKNHYRITQHAIQAYLLLGAILHSEVGITIPQPIVC